MRVPSLTLPMPIVAAIFASAALAQGPAPAPQVAIPQQISCIGEEPFWRLDANRTTGNLQRLGGKARQTVELRGELAAISFLAPRALVWRGNSTRLPGETIVATLREEACRSSGCHCTASRFPPVCSRASTHPSSAVAAIRRPVPMTPTA